MACEVGYREARGAGKGMEHFKIWDGEKAAFIHADQLTTIMKALR
jgi:hypothetical protein